MNELEGRMNKITLPNTTIAALLGLNSPADRSERRGRRAVERQMRTCYGPWVRIWSLLLQRRRYMGKAAALTPLLGAVLVAIAAWFAPAAQAQVEHRCSPTSARIASLAADTGTPCVEAMSAALAAIENRTVLEAGRAWQCEDISTRIIQCFGTPSGWMMFTYRSATFDPRQGLERVRFRIVTNDDGYVARIGRYRTRNGTYRSARRVFGRPSSVNTRTHACRVKWRTGLQIDFQNLGGGPRCMYPQAMRVTSDRFATIEGLAPRMPSERVLDIYDDAAFHTDGGQWWLETAYSPFGDGGEYPVISATVAGGRVTAINGWIGRAGE